jgi:hypothetical protein
MNDYLDMTGKLTASEAIFGFAGWLTSRDDPVIMSANHESDKVAELCDLFCLANRLQKPRDEWANNLIIPSEKRSKQDDYLMVSPQSANYRYEYICDAGGYVVCRDVFEGNLRCPPHEAVMANKVAVFVTESEAQNYCDYRNAMAIKNGTDDVLAIRLE